MKTISRRLALAFAGLSILGANPAACQEASELPEKLSKLQASWTKAREKTTSSIDQKYLGALKPMMTSYAESGDIVASLAVKREIARVEKGTAEPTEMKKAPAKLTKLQSSWQRARDKAGAPIDAKYQKALKDLAKSYMDGGQIESATATEAELAKFKKADAPPKPEEKPALGDPEPKKTDTLQIVKAMWGTRAQLDEGGGHNVTEKLRSHIKDGKIAVKAVYTNFGDPAPGKTKYIIVEYIKAKSIRVRTAEFKSQSEVKLP